MAEAAIFLDRREVLETAVLPIAPTPVKLAGSPAAMGVRKVCAAWSLEEGVDGPEDDPERPMPTLPISELAIDDTDEEGDAAAADAVLLLLVVCDSDRLKKGLTEETRSVKESEMLEFEEMVGTAPAEEDRILLSSICCFRAEGVIG